MKFSLFVHMERVDPDQNQQSLYQEMIELCRIADEGGLYAIWTGEHHCMNFTIAPNPFINIADIARFTKNVRLGTGTIIAPFWHPIRLAGEAAMTDIITEGRLELGIARGAYSFEYERLMPGLDAWEAGKRMRELIPAIQKLWKGDYTHDGEYWQFPKSTSSPKPLTVEGPPIWVAARDINSHEFAVMNGCNVLVTPLHMGDDEVESLMQRFHSACVKYSRASKPKIMLLRHAYVAESQEDAQTAAKEINRFYCYFGAWFKNERPVSHGLIQQLTDEEIAKHPFCSPQKMLENQVIGEASSVIERLKKYESLGYDEFAFWIDSGMSFERKKNSLKRFIEDVIPAFS